MYKYILFLLGILLISLSITFMILYLNLLTIGFSFWEYILFIIKKLECLLIVPGLLIIFLLFRKE